MARPIRSTRKAIALSAARYWNLTQQPLQSLWFLLPLMIFYELALPIYGTDAIHRVSEDIYARQLMSQFFEWFGVTGYYLPGLIVVVVLLSWHFVRHDKITFQPRVYALMLAESALLALPLFVFLVLLARHLQLQALWGVRRGGLGWPAQIVFSIGAGIYEEMLFRLVAIAVLHMVIVDLLALPPRVGAVGAIAISSLLFALYHFPDQTRTPLELGRFIQFTVAGIYLACVYVLRGFGVVAGTHAVYDVLVVLSQVMHPR